MKEQPKGRRLRRSPPPKKKSPPIEGYNYKRTLHYLYTTKRLYDAQEPIKNNGFSRVPNYPDNFLSICTTKYDDICSFYIY